MNVAGRMITAVYRSSWRSAPGVEIPGIAGPTWDYCHIILDLDGELLLRVVPGDTRLIEDSTSNLVKLGSDHEDIVSCVGERIRDVITFDDGEPMVLVLLSGDRYFQSSYGVGGTDAGVSRFSEWEAEELADCSYRSLLTGVRGTLSEIACDT